MADQSDLLNSRLAELAHTKGGGLTLKGGTYTVDHTVWVPETVTLDASGVDFVQLTDGRELTYPREKSYEVGLRDRAVIDVHGHLIGGTTIGTNVNSLWLSDVEAQHGVRVHDGGTVDGTKVRNVWGDGAYADGANVHLAHLDVIGTGRQGVGCSNATGLRLSDSTFDRIARSVIDFEPSARINERVLDALISRCTFGTFGLGNDGGGAIIASGGDGYVEGVTVEDCTSAGPFLVNVGSTSIRRKGYTIRRCSGGGTLNRQAFTFTNIDGVTVDACHQAFATAKAGMAIQAVKLTDCTNVNVSGDFPGAG